MSPNHSFNDHSDMGLAYIVNSSKLGLAVFSSCIKSSYFQNLIVFKNMIRLKLAMHFEGSSLGAAICAVIKRCAGSEMVGIAAARIAYAGMKDPKPVRDYLFIVGHPGNSVRLAVCSFSRRSNLYPAISVKFASHPGPAFIRSSHFYIGPKPFLDFIRQELLKQFGGYRIWAHSITWLIVCQAPGLVIAGAFLF